MKSNSRKQQIKTLLIKRNEIDMCDDYNENDKKIMMGFYGKKIKKYNPEISI